VSISSNRPSSRRIAQWALKYDAGRVAQLIELGKPRYQQNAAVAFSELYDIEQRTKEQMNGHAIPVSLVTSYLCFAREVWKAQSRHHGELLAREVAVKVAKWKARILDEDILWEIARKVFDINPPAVA
jgi:hypothetical protein